jgi:hypothetical protein
MRVLIDANFVSADVEISEPVELRLDGNFEGQLVTAITRALRAVGANPAKIGRMVAEYEGEDNEDR